MYRNGLPMRLEESLPSRICLQLVDRLERSLEVQHGSDAGHEGGGEYEIESESR